MTTLAFYRNGDLARVVEYTTKNGWHRFNIDGDEKLVVANPHIPPIDVDSLTLHVRSEGTRASKRQAKRLESAVEDRGAKLRFFDTIGRGVVETPVAGFAELHRRVVAMVAEKGLRYDEEVGEYELVNIEPVLRDLSKMGIKPAVAMAFLQHLAATFDSSEAASYASDRTMEWLGEVAIPYALVIFGLLYGLILGIEIGVNPAVADFWNGPHSTWIVLGSIGAGLVLWVVKGR